MGATKTGEDVEGHPSCGGINKGGNKVNGEAQFGGSGSEVGHAGGNDGGIFGEMDFFHLINGGRTGGNLVNKDNVASG